MERTRKALLALGASALLALGVAAPAVAGPPPTNPGGGTGTACEVLPPEAEVAADALECEVILPPPPDPRE